MVLCFLVYGARFIIQLMVHGLHFMVHNFTVHGSEV